MLGVMETGLQGSLLDLCDEPAPGPLGASVRRTMLDHGAWVDFRPGWMAGAGVLFERLARRRALAGGTAPDVRPGGRRAAAALLLRRGCSTCPTRAGRGAGRPSAGTTGRTWASRCCTAGLCLYRDGRDSVAWHGDRIGRGAREDTVVAILSLGARAPCCSGPAAAARRCATTLGHGDLLVMGGSCQRTWEHAVPKTARATGPRISVQFRPRDVR